MARYKLGANLTAPRPRLKLEDYLHALPTPPAVFGHQQIVSEWGMLGNDQVGDCVIAGGMHETMLWTLLGDAPDAEFSTQLALDTYGAIAGYDPGDPSTDQGTDPDAAAKYRRKTGLTDTAGIVHRIAAYVAVKPEHVPVATWLFGAVGVCVQVPASAMDQFDRGEPWDVVEGSQIEGGHYVPCVGRANGNFLVVTWGRVQPVTPAFMDRYCDYALAYLSEEMLTGGKSPENLDINQLRADLAAV